MSKERNFDEYIKKVTPEVPVRSNFGDTVMQAVAQISTQPKRKRSFFSRRMQYAAGFALCFVIMAATVVATQNGEPMPQQSAQTDNSISGQQSPSSNNEVSKEQNKENPSSQKTQSVAQASTVRKDADVLVSDISSATIEDDSFSSTRLDDSLLQ